MLGLHIPAFSPETVLTVKIFSDLLMIVAPWGVFNSFLSFTENDPEHRPRMAFNIAFVCFTIMVFSLFGGGWLIDKFGGFQAFRLVGNALVVRLGLSMLDGQVNTLKLSNDDRLAFAIVPLATPLLVGPGTISTIVLAYSSHHGSVYPFLIAFFLVSVCIYTVLRSAVSIHARLGSYGPVVFRVLNSITGLLVMSLGASGFCECLLKMFPGLAGLR